METFKNRIPFQEHKLYNYISFNVPFLVSSAQGRYNGVSAMPKILQMSAKKWPPGIGLLVIFFDKCSSRFFRQLRSHSQSIS